MENEPLSTTLKAGMSHSNRFRTRILKKYMRNRSISEERNYQHSNDEDECNMQQIVDEAIIQSLKQSSDIPKIIPQIISSMNCIKCINSSSKNCGKCKYRLCEGCQLIQINIRTYVCYNCDIGIMVRCKRCDYIGNQGFEDNEFIGDRLTKCTCDCDCNKWVCLNCRGSYCKKCLHLECR